MADNAPVMIWATDPDRRRTYLSRSWFDFTGQKPKTHSVSAVSMPSHPDDSPARLAGKRLLVVEDEPLVALDLVDILEEAGAEVAGSAGTAKEALNIIENASLDAALLDANLGCRSFRHWVRP
jgi:hypothetical protein